MIVLKIHWITIWQGNVLKVKQFVWKLIFPKMKVERMDWTVSAKVVGDTIGKNTGRKLWCGT